MKRIFLTGATGYLGCHLAHRFVSDGHEVIALVRDNRDESTQDRLEQALLQVGPLTKAQLARLTAVSGTVQDTPQQLIQTYREQMGDQPIHELWHSAAIFNFKERDRDKVRAVNIHGTENMLAVATKINATDTPRFIYISTAYCTGRENNTAVPETIPQNISDFRSVYEWSKHEAELRVQQAQREHTLDAFVLRPSIIVGTPQTQVICTSGYYQVMAECGRLRDIMETVLGDNFNGNVQTRLLGNSENPLNLIPIDFVVNGMIALAQHPDLNNRALKVFNLANEAPPTITTVHRAVTQSLGIRGLALVPASTFEEEPMTPIETKVNRRISFQAPYMHEEINFSTNCFREYIPKEQLPTPAVDLAYLKKINHIFLSEQAKENVKREA